MLGLGSSGSNGTCIPKVVGGDVETDEQSTGGLQSGCITFALKVQDCPMEGSNEEKVFKEYCDVPRFK
jgi:hypothetical protein